MEEKSDLDNLKKEYKKIQEKHELPGFVDLNKDFHIEKISECDTDLLIREVRKYMADKFSNYLRFIEALINPSNAPMFIYSVVKTIGEDEKKILTDSYKKLAKIEVDLIELDLEYVEEFEIKFIKESYKIWQEIKKDLLNVFRKIKDNWDVKSEVNGKAYFG